MEYQSRKQIIILYRNISQKILATKNEFKNTHIIHIKHMNRGIDMKSSLIAILIIAFLILVMIITFIGIKQEDEEMKKNLSARDYWRYRYM